MKRKLMSAKLWRTNAKHLLLQVAVILLFTISAFAQQSIRGRILDEKSNPLSGATVQVKGANQTTQSDQQGNYTIIVPSVSSVLRVSFVGYEPKEIPVRNLANLNVILAPVNAAMGEV